MLLYAVVAYIGVRVLLIRTISYIGVRVCFIFVCGQFSCCDIFCLDISGQHTNLVWLRLFVFWCKVAEITNTVAATGFIFNIIKPYLEDFGSYFLV